MPTIKFAASSHVGKVRKENEDYLLAVSPLFAVADGMGGHKAGDVASKLAVTTLSKCFPKTAKMEKLQAIKSCFSEANRLVLERAQKTAHEKGMGTTLTFMNISDDTAYFGHIGDSRAYLLRGSKLRQLTKDHSLVADLIKEGKLSEAEAQEHPYRNIITKALGSEVAIEADFFTEKVKPGDKILLCSDGLSSMVDDNKIKQIISQPLPLKKLCQQLIETANAAGGQDNITVIVAELSEQVFQLKTKLLKVGVATASLIGAIIALYLAFNFVVQNNYYLGFYKGKVAVYHGLPYRIGWMKLSKVEKVSSIRKNTLTSIWTKRIENKITVKNKYEAEKALESIAEEGTLEPKKR